MLTRRAPALVVLLALAVSCARSKGQARRADEVASGRVAWDRHIEIASGPAVRGPWQMNESDYRWVDDPAVDIAKNGDAVVAWVDQTGKDLFFQRFAASGEPRLSSPTNVSKSGATFSWLPRIVSDESDPSRVYLLWQEIVFSPGGSHGGEILFARTSDGGRTFEPPINLSTSKQGDGKGRLDEKTWDNGSLDLAPGPEGDLYAAWTEYEGTLWLRHSADRGGAWSQAVRVGGGAPARAPSVATASDGTVWVAWTVGEDPKSDVRVARSGDGGRSFGEPIVIVDEGHSDAPQLAVDHDGTVHLVWAESPKGRSGTYSVHYARSKRGTGAFEPPRTIAEASTSPTVSVDARGRVYVLSEPRTEDAQRRGLGVSYSLDGGESFGGRAEVHGIAGQELGVNGSQQGMLADKLAVDEETGAIAVVNSTFELGRVSHVRLVRGRLLD